MAASVSSLATFTNNCRKSQNLMTIRVALHHKTVYTYDRLVSMGAHIVRLRPAPHCRTPIVSYSLNIEPKDHFLNWQQDPHGNHIARLVFPKQTTEFSVGVDLIAEMTVVNPFDFFLEEYAEAFPFTYEPWLKSELTAYRTEEEPGPLMKSYLETVEMKPQRTIDFLVELNKQIHRDVCYVIRMEPGVQSPEETLSKRSGSCRDSAWLLVNVLRHLGLAARFASGYLIQLAPDLKALDGPSGTEVDFTDLHAWTEVYLPGAGWVGLDPTSGLFCGEGHIPLACTPEPSSAAPVTGAVDPCETTFQFEMEVVRVHEDPRVTKPYTDEQWQRITRLGNDVDRHLHAADVRLTMGGEPTFVSIDDMEGDEWNTAAVGPTKRMRADVLSRRLRERFAQGALLHYGQGKWYPGEPLPRWAFTLISRKDGLPVWRQPKLMADETTKYEFTFEDARRFIETLAKNLEVTTDTIVNGYEDVAYYAMSEMRLPINVEVFDNKLKDRQERERIVRLFERGIGKPTGCVLPLRRNRWSSTPHWMTAEWSVRRDQFYLLPGDSAMGFRLPLDSLPYVSDDKLSQLMERDPIEPLAPLPIPKPLRRAAQAMVPAVPLGVASTSAANLWSAQSLCDDQPQDRPSAEHWGFGEGVAMKSTARKTTLPGGDGGSSHSGYASFDGSAETNGETHTNGSGGYDSVIGHNGTGNGHHGSGQNGHGQSTWANPVPVMFDDGWVRTALVVEPREGRLFVFLPPVETAECFLELIAAIEETATELSMPVAVEGYLPPYDPRLLVWKVTPDPGVIEVNTPPTETWNELSELTTGLYEEARLSRLGTEKFMLDGRHSGTGGGNHVVLGGKTPADSPFLRRPDLLRSLISFWVNHPSLSYLFSGLFIGPTSQAPRVDEGRRDTLYELELAFEQIPDHTAVPPWLVDRIFRNLLIDVTGNTHRSEFCIDKLYSPDSSTGRLGLVEFRGFEMPPHARMSLTQQLLIRALVAWFWEEPYRHSVVHWGTSLHDRFMLPHFLEEDFKCVIGELQNAGFAFEADWFDPHFEFRCQKIGELSLGSVHIEFRTALEPWYVLGEEGAPGGTARYVDSSVERLQVKVKGLTPGRHILTVNGRRIPLHPTGTESEYVAGVRYRAWQPPSCLHPTIGIHSPLTFDVIDTWLERSVGGAQYHVVHPGGRGYDVFPVNSYEAESRRMNRFFKMNHTGGSVRIPPEHTNRHFPFTLDLRRPSAPMFM